MKKFVSTFFICCAILVFAFALGGCAATGYTVFPATAVFSGDILFTAKLIGGRADHAYKRMVDVLEEIDAQASVTREDGDLYRFNAAGAGERVEVGRHCYELFSLSEEYYELTDGAFNCAALPLSELWHIDARSVYEPGSRVFELPSRDDVEQALSYCDPALVTASASDGKYYLTKTDPRVRLDFGGIAKGYATDKCAEVLGEYDISSAFIDISGNAYFYGDYINFGNAEKWHVGITAPRPRAAETVELSRGVVAAVDIAADNAAVTSGDYMRYRVYEANGEAVYIPHILGGDGVPLGVYYDELSGSWKNTEDHVISATVIGTDGAKCDALSTAVAALGSEDGARLLQKVGCKGLIFTEKRYTIVGGVDLYKPDVYDGYKAYEFYGG